MVGWIAYSDREATRKALVDDASRVGRRRGARNQCVFPVVGGAVSFEPPSARRFDRLRRAGARYSGRSARGDADRLDRGRPSRIEHSSAALGFASVARPCGAGQSGDWIGLRLSLRRQRGLCFARGARFDRNSGLCRWQTHLRNRNDSFAGAIPPSVAASELTGKLAIGHRRSPGRFCRPAAKRARDSRDAGQPGVSRRDAAPAEIDRYPHFRSADKRSSPPTRLRPAAGPSASLRAQASSDLDPARFSSPRSWRPLR